MPAIREFIVLRSATTDELETAMDTSFPRWDRDGKYVQVLMECSETDYRPGVYTTQLRLHYTRYGAYAVDGEGVELRLRYVEDPAAEIAAHVSAVRHGEWMNSPW